MKKPRVLHLVNNLNVSGASVLLLDTASCLRPGPGEFVVCTLEEDNPLAEALAAAGAVVVAGGAASLLGATAWARRMIREHAPDIVHAHLIPATQVGWLAARLTHVPAVTTVHFTFDCLNRGRMVRRLAAASYRLYGGIFAISEAVRASVVVECDVPEDRVTVLRNGVDFARLDRCGPDARETARRTLGLGPEHTAIGYVGRLDRIKGVHILVTAFARLRTEFPAVRLVIVGGGDQRKRLESLAQDLDLGGSVIFAGEQHDAAAHLAAVDLFVLPSLTEGLGLSLVEAMAAGLPVVASRAGGIPEVVSHDETGLLFAPGNSEDLASCLNEMMRFPGLRRRLAAAGKAAVRREFAIDGHVERLYAEYDRMIGTSGKRLAEAAR